MKTKTQFTNRILSLVLSIMMVVSMLPMNVLTASAEAEESNRVIYCDIGPWTSLTGLKLKYSSDNSTINEIVMEKVSDNIWKADLTTNDLTGQTIQFVGENVMSVGTVVPADKNCFRITEYNGTTVGYEGVWYQYPCASHDYKDGICACGVACTHTGGTATCQDPAVCEACGVSYGDKDANIHTPTEGTIFTVNDNGTHSYTCACGAAVAEVPHTLDVTTGKCGACGADMTAIATVTDGTNTYYAADAATLNQAVTAILETGSRTFTVELPADAEAGMITTIRRAICDTEGVADGSIHLTLKGVTSIPGTTNWDGVAFGPGDIYDEAGKIVDQELVTQLASINLPDVTEIGAQAFYFCENLVTVSAPKAQTIGAQALGYTALTSVEFPELTTIPTDMFSGTWTLSSAKFPKVTTIEQGGLLVGAKFTPENNPTPFPLELTAEGNITFNGSNHFNIASQNYSGKVDLVLCCDKKDAVTFNEDGTATWQVREDLSYTFKSITFKHSYVNGKCTACGEDCTHTGGTATCTNLAVCDICKTAYGELGGHTYNTAGSCTVCDYVCPHSNFDSATGNCKDCEISLAIAKVETGGNTTYYQTADELRTAVDSYSADQTITLLADFAVIKGLDFHSDSEAKNTLDLNGHTLTYSDPSERIDVESGELTITGPGSINIFMTADNEGAKIVVGSGVTLNDTLRSVYGGVLDLTNATIPEAGLNVILYSDDSDPTTYNVSDVLLLPADYYFFVDGKAVYTYSGETEGTVLKHAEHNYTYTDNGDGTHDATCTACGAVVDNEAHSGGTATCTEQAECQHCGASYGELAAHTPDTNGKCTAENCGYQYAAKVGDTFYETIHKALQAAEGINGCTLTLLDDVTLTSMSSYVSYVNTGTFTLDLNGKTLSSNKRTLEVMGSADLTIRDGIGGGKIVSTDSSAVYLSGGKLTIESGTFEGTLDGVFLSGTSTLIVKGGTFTGSRAMITGFGSNCVIDLTNIDPAGFTLKNNGSGTFAPKLPEGYGMVGSDGKLLTSLSAEQSATVHKHEYKYTDLGDGNHQQACSCGLTTGEPVAHSTTAEDDKGATCAASAYCSVCESYYGEVDKNNHDETVAYENGFCPYCDAFEPAELVDGVYEISNAGQLYWFAQQVNGGNTAIDGKLTTNIVDNTGDVAGCNGTKAEGWRDWTPIGTSNDRYTGTFDGGSFTVSGLYFNNSGTSNVGLFGYIGGDGAVHDLGVVNSYISGGSDVGGVVGYALATVSVTNCYNSATVIGVNYVGGVVGYSAGPIANCHNSGTVCGTGGIGAAGGVVGRCYRTVTNCHNTGSVTGTGSLGGVAGFSSGSVTNCYNTGNVSGSGNGVGGVAGSNTGSVTNCYNTGDVTGSKYTVGGMVGANSGGTVTNCYNTGSVTGSKYYVGGVVGQNGNTGTVTNCYYLTGCAKDGNDAVQFGIGSGTQGNTTADADGGTTGKSDFSTGEVCYLLNGDQTSVVFKQTCGTGIPVFTGETVYYGYRSCGDTEAVYTNNANVFPEKPEHTQNPTYTDNHDGTHSAVYPCCGTTVTEDHTLTYTAKDNVITAACSANCGYSETATISTEDTTYNGTEQKTATVTYSDGWKSDELNVSYENNVNAGTATASITIGEVTASVEFTIEKATVTVTADAKSKPYGTDNPTLTYTSEGLLGDDVLTGALETTATKTSSVGEYDITVGSLANSNYTIVFVGAKLTITKADSSCTAPVAVSSLTFNGGNQNLITAGTATGGTMQYSLDGSNWSETIPTGKDADTYTVYYKVVGDGNHNDADGGSLSVTIAPKVITNPVIEGIDAQYLHTDSAITPVPTAVKDGNTVIDPSEYTLTYENNINEGTATLKIVDVANGNYTVSGSKTFQIVVHAHVWNYSASGNTITATCNGNFGTCPDAEQSFTLNAPDVGYSGNPVEAEVTRDGTDHTFTLHYTGINYDSADAPTNAGDYTVTMTVGDKSVSDTFTISPKDISKVASCQFSLTQICFVYSGKAPVLNVTGVDSSIGSYTMQEGTDYTVGTVQVNAGSHKLTVTGIGNYTGTVKLDYTITAKEVSITGAVIQPVTYNPNGYTLTVTGVTFNGVVDGETLAYTAEATLGNTNAVGEQDATVTVTLNNSNYNLATATYQTKVTINKAAATVTAAPTPNTLAYTGEGQYLISAGEAVGGEMQYSTDNQTWSTTIPQGTDAGKYTVYYKVVGDANHSDTAVDSVEVTIAKAQAVITVDTTTITGTYGETVSLPTATTNFGNVVCDKTADDLVNAGTYTVTYTVAGTENFEGATKTLTVKVERLAVAEPTVTGTYAYTGNELTAQLIGVESYMTVASGNKGTNAGNYEVEVTLDGNHKWADGSDGKVQWSIDKAKAEISVTTDPITVTYGETVTLPTATTNFGTVVCNKKASDIVNADTYTVTYTVAGTDNYDGDTKAITVIVNAKPITVTADALSKTYGEADPALTYTAQGLVNGDELTGELKRVAGENVGSYAIEQNTLTAGNNYTITYTGAKLTINKRSVTVTAKDQTLTYGETISGTEITANGLVDGHSVTVTLTPSTANVTVDGTITASAAIITAGTADVTANYEITYAGGKLVIEPDMSKIAGLTTDNVTSANEADIKAVQEMMAKADSVKDEWAAISTTCEDLIEKIEAVEAQKKEATDKAASFDADTVKSTDKANLTQLAEKIETLLDTDNLTEDERTALETVLEQVNGMIDTIEDIAEDSKAATDAIDALDAATVTSADKGKLEQAIETIEDLLAGNNLTEEERKALEDAQADAKALIDVISAAAGATDTENTEKVEDVTPENVTPEDKTDLQKAKDDLEKALEDNGGNYTEEEKKAIQEEIDRIDSAITALENVENVTEAIAQLPESVEPDNEAEAEKILATKEGYDALTDHEKSLVSEDAKKKLDDLVASLTAYDIVKGDGSSWTEDSNGTISFTANGAFSKFVGIKVDGVDVDKANYEAKAGSTIITLKASYLDTLKVGEHTITVVYNDGSTDGTFKIVAKPNTPATGDDFNIALYGSLMAVSVTALVVLLLVSKKRKYAK